MWPKRGKTARQRRNVTLFAHCYDIFPQWWLHVKGEDELASWALFINVKVFYAETADANFKCALWIYKQQLALKMRAHRISIVFQSNLFIILVSLGELNGIKFIKIIRDIARIEPGSLA